MSEYEKYYGEVDIKTTGKNLFNTIKIGNNVYIDNIPENFNIGITKKQFIEYEQLKEENKQLKETIKEATRILNSAKNHYGNDGKNWALERVIDLLGDKENE